MNLLLRLTFFLCPKPRALLLPELTLLAGLLLSVFVSLKAEDREPALNAPESPSGAVRQVHSIQQFWDLSNEEKKQSVLYDLECYVTYYDSEWKTLWIQDETSAACVALGNTILPVRAGQRIRVVGTTQGDIDISFKGATFTVLAKQSPAPVLVKSSIELPNSYNNRLCTIEAVVDRQESFGMGRQHLYLSLQGRLVYAWLLFPVGQPPPNLTHSLVRFTGVYVEKLTPTGQLAELTFMMSSPEQIELVTPLSSDLRFNAPTIEIGALPKQPSDTRVLVRGQVVAQDPGHNLTVRDESGQIELISAQTLPCPVGSQVDAIGYPFIVGTNWKLMDATFRRSLGSTPTVDKVSPPKMLRLAAQLNEISPEQAAAGMPVFLTGVVTWSHPDAPFFYIQDSSGGACIYRGMDTSKVRPPGRSVDVTGNTSLGDFAPVVTASKVVKTGDVILPEAMSVSLEHALGGSAEAQWVEMRGFLRHIHREQQWTRLEISTAAGDFNALLPATENIPDLSGAVIRVHGVCNAQTNERRQIKSIRLWVPSIENIQVEQEAPKDIFETPSRSLSSIGQFGAPLSTNRRVKLSGQVLQSTPGHSLYLYDQGESLLINTRDTLTLVPGDLVDAVGFLSRQNSRIVLREATCRKTGHSAPPRSVEIPVATTLHEELDGHLARVTATLADTSPLGDRTRLAFQQNGISFEAFIPNPHFAAIEATCPVGSQLELTGIYELDYNELGRPDGFHLILRNADDIGVRSTPSWFTRSRIIAVTATLVVCVLFIMSWVVILRRRVARQTEQIREQLQRENRLAADLQRASKLESLGLLAGGIAHDFNNLLTIIMGNLSLSITDPGLSAETQESMRDASNAVTRARDLTQQLLTFSKGGSPVRTAIMLADIVQEVALFSVRGSKVSCVLDFAPDLAPANVDKGQISQVVQNIVINAVQAMPGGGQIFISLKNEQVSNQFGPILAPGAYLCLTLRDTGPGISPETLGKIFDPYFTTKKSGSGIGLATVHSIVRKHSGHISVESKLGQGTSFRIWLPAALAEHMEAVGTTSSNLPILKGHIMILDDEPEVRRLASSMVRRLGLTCTTVSDGAEAVKRYLEAHSNQAPYDLLILDLTVPGGFGGIQVMEELTKIDPAVRAIVSSGYSAELSIANYRDCGFLDVVPKPYELNDLAKVLAKYLKQ